MDLSPSSEHAIVRCVARTSLAALALVIVGVIAGASGANGSIAQTAEGVVVARDGELFAVALTSRAEVRLTSTRAWERGPAVSPDGQTIVYERLASDRSKAQPTLWKMQLDGSGQSSLGVAGGSPAWAPGGKAIYFTRPFSSKTCDGANIWRTSATGRGSVRITRGDRTDQNPAVSPDGRLLAFNTSECLPGAPYGMFQMTLATRKIKDFPRLRSSLELSYYPAWSPDGARIAFNTGVDNAFPHVYVARADGSGARGITRSGLGAYSPAWSPDGSLIAILGGRNYDVYVIRPDGSGLQQITNSKGEESDVAWLPRMPG